MSVIQSGPNSTDSKSLKRELQLYKTVSSIFQCLSIVRASSSQQWLTTLMTTKPHTTKRSTAKMQFITLDLTILKNYLCNLISMRKECTHTAAKQAPKALSSSTMLKVAWSIKLKLPMSSATDISIKTCSRVSIRSKWQGLNMQLMLSETTPFLFTQRIKLRSPMRKAKVTSRLKSSFKMAQGEIWNHLIRMTLKNKILMMILIIGLKIGVVMTVVTPIWQGRILRVKIGLRNGVVMTVVTPRPQGKILKARIKSHKRRPDPWSLRMSQWRWIASAQLWAVKKWIASNQKVKVHLNKT